MSENNPDLYEEFFVQVQYIIFEWDLVSMEDWMESQKGNRLCEVCQKSFFEEYPNYKGKKVSGSKVIKLCSTLELVSFQHNTSKSYDLVFKCSKCNTLLKEKHIFRNNISNRSVKDVKEYLKFSINSCWNNIRESRKFISTFS